MARKLIVEIVGDSRSLERAFARSTNAGKRFSVGMTGIGRSLAGVTAGFATVAGGIRLVTAAFSEMGEANRVAAQTAAVIKSTGGVAGVTAGHVDALADALLRKTGIDDEAIASAANLLLTFTNVRNVTGKGNQVFDQATEAVLDLSVAMGTDLQSAAKMVAKALNDPVRGATALRRAGVQLSKQQEKDIKTLVEHGRVLDAQKIILRELTRQVGGSAEAAGKVQPWNLLRETILNIGEQMARVFLPAIQNVVDRLQRWFDNTRNVAELMARFRDIVGTTGAVISTVADAARRFADAVGGWKNTLTILIGMWAGFRLAGIVAAGAVMTANIVAAGVVKRAWQAALISTGFGALAVAAGIAAAYVITHWEKVKGWFYDFWGWLELSANKAVLKVVEVFSHIPREGGQWARDLKEQIKFNMAQIEAEAATRAGKAGEKSGESFADRYLRELKAAQAKFGKLTPGTATAPGGVPRLGGAGRTAADRVSLRNRIFDARIARQTDRLQDLSLRKQLAGLRQVAQAIRARMAATRDITRRLNLEDKLLDVLRQQRSVQEQIGDQIRAANQALKDRAEAIKSAVIERLQRRQTDILNRRALQDAREQLRIARQIGGPKGIQAAVRELQDVKLQMQIARVEAAPATLTAGGRFGLGGMVTINIHGVTDPEAVARRVTEILKRRRRRTTTQIRPTAAGNTA